MAGYDRPLDMSFEPVGLLVGGTPKSAFTLMSGSEIEMIGQHVQACSNAGSVDHVDLNRPCREIQPDSLEPPLVRVMKLPSLINTMVTSVIIGSSIFLGAKVIVAGQPERVLYVEVPAIAASATATAPADRVPLRIAGDGDSSMEWGLAGAFMTLSDLRYDIDWVRPDDHHSYATLGCPLVDDGMPFVHAGGDAWGPIGNGDATTCVPGKIDADVIIASWGPTSMWDRRTADGARLSILNPAYRAAIETQMDAYEAMVDRPVVWMSYYDEPSPTLYEAAFLDLVSQRTCSFSIDQLNLKPSDYEPDLIHLSPQGSLTVAAALVEPVKQCVSKGFA